MDLTRVKVLLKKLNRLVEGMDSDEHLSDMERDLMKAYLRDMYDHLLHSRIKENRSRTSKQRAGKTSPASKSVEQAAEKEEKSDDDGLSIPRLQPDESGQREREEQSSSSEERSPDSTSPEQEEDKESPEANSETEASADQTEDELDEEIKELFDVREGNELSERLSHMPVRDLSRAMGLNERIYTINELFGGDHALFDEVLETLNDLDSFEEAKKYLTDKVAKKYDWTHPDRKKKAHHFIRLVRRRYKRQIV